MAEPAILYIDIETTMNILGGWGVGKQYLTFENILKEREVSIVGYAWNDEKVQVEHFDLNKYVYTKYDDDADKKLLEKVSKLIAKADLVVAHNGKYFDISVMRSRLIKHKLPDFSPILMDDSYDQTKSINFNSHKLDYLGKYLDVGRKTEHGLDLWLGIIHKDRKALAKQITYCKGDVELLRRVYKRLKPYIKSSINLAIFKNDERKCPHCGSQGTLVARKNKYTRAGVYKQYQCKNCGMYSSSGKNQIVKPSGYAR